MVRAESASHLLSERKIQGDDDRDSGMTFGQETCLSNEFIALPHRLNDSMHRPVGGLRMPDPTHEK
jgi:hypothetical protein